MIYQTFVIIGSILSAGFGIWHLFVPKIWNWYSYIKKDARELVLAVRAVNLFFSLSLILIGFMNTALVLHGQTSEFTLIAVLCVNIVLWLVRTILQIVSPQGTVKAALRYGMLAAFLLILALFSASLAFVLFHF